MAVVRAFSLEQASRLARVSERQAAYWAHRGVLQPSILYDRERRPTRYLYSFEDVVGLRVIGILRNRYGLSLQMLRKAGKHLQELADRPWSELTFWVRGKELFVFDPNQNAVVPTDGRHQATEKIEIEPVVSDVERDARDLARRRAEDIGRTEQHRSVLGNQLVVKGIRVPVDVILSMAHEGYGYEAIVAAYPSLTREDVCAVLSAHNLAAVA